jgi:four helix bundle protein
MTLKEYIKKFNFKKPDWSGLPEGFPECDLEGLTPEEVGKFSAILSLWELSRPKKQKARSRVWESSSGYIYLVAWSNASLLRVLGRRFTTTLPRSEYRLKAQLDDSLRSSVANIEEGFARPTTSEYLAFLGYTQGSLKEAKGDFQRCRQDGFLKSVSGSSLAGVGINLKDWHEALKRSVISYKSPQSPLKSPKETRGSYRKLKDIKGKTFQFGYSPVDNLKVGDLTYEIFIELVNKTDWHLRRLVESLERKLEGERKSYKVEKARIRGKGIGYRA